MKFFNVVAYAFKVDCMQTTVRLKSTGMSCAETTCDFIAVAGSCPFMGVDDTICCGL